MDLHTILNKIANKDLIIDSAEWTEVYNKLTEILYFVGALTHKNKTINNIIDELDKIDSSDF